MKILYKKVGEAPTVMDVENELHVLQGLVDGYIETAPTPVSRVVIVCDEEGKLKGKRPNFVNEDLIVGDAFFVGIGRDDFIDLTEEQIAQIKKIYF